MIRKVFLLLGMVCTTLYCKAQLSPFQAIYFQDRYLANPAMAGVQTGLLLSAGYRQQKKNFPGAPKSQVFTASYQATQKVGLGLNVTDESAGLIRQTRMVGTYAYHLPLSSTLEKLNFGLSFGINNSRLQQDKLIGNETDEQIARYNQAKPYADGDLGIAYTSEGLFAQVVVPNLKAAFFRSSLDRLDVDRVTFLSTVSYKIPAETAALYFEPLLAYRRIKGGREIFDVGMNCDMVAYHVALQAVYHSYKTTGIGLVFDQDAFAFSLVYNLQTGFVNNESSGALELGLTIKVFQKK